MFLTDYIAQFDCDKKELLQLDNQGSHGIFVSTDLANIPWQQNTPWALNQDFDHDGIPDALDNYNGPGAHASITNVPWQQNTPWALNQDFDHDGIPDALDNYNGPGAHANANLKSHGF